MKTIITLFIILLLLVTIGLQPVSQGVKGENSRHMNHVCCTLADADSGSDGIGGPSFDTGYNSLFF